MPCPGLLFRSILEAEYSIALAIPPPEHGSKRDFARPAPAAFEAATDLSHPVPPATIMAQLQERERFFDHYAAAFAAFDLQPVSVPQVVAQSV